MHDFLTDAQFGFEMVTVQLMLCFVYILSYKILFVKEMDYIVASLTKSIWYNLSLMFVVQDTCVSTWGMRKKLLNI